MTIHRLEFLLLLIFSFFPLPTISAQSDAKPDLTTLSDSDLKTVTIKLERTRCYGSCPAYTVTIHGDGNVEYEGKKFVSVIETREGHVELDKIKALLAEFGKADYWNFPTQYVQENCTRYCTDMPTAITELSVKGMKQSVKHYYGCGGAPQSLFDLESAIDKTSGVERWTGDVSKAGPFGTTCWSGKRGETAPPKQ